MALKVMDLWCKVGFGNEGVAVYQVKELKDLTMAAFQATSQIFPGMTVNCPYGGKYYRGDIEAVHAKQIKLVAKEREFKGKEEILKTIKVCSTSFRFSFYFSRLLT